MREIKFRSWDEQNKIMHNEVEFIRSGTDGDDWILFKSDKQKLEDGNVLNNPYFQQQIKVMQYTGLKDKNGVLIFEGDVIKINVSHFNGIGEVIFHKGCFMIKYNEDDLSELYGDNLYSEIIGNIYENQELLES